MAGGIAGLAAGLLIYLFIAPLADAVGNGIRYVIEPGSIWGGVPAKFIKKVDPEQAKELNQKIAHNYLMYSQWYK